MRVRGGAEMDTAMKLRKSQEVRTVAIMDSPIDRVRSLIAAGPMSQGELAEAVGLDASKMSKSLGGQRRFSSLEYARIAEVCGVSVDWLLTGATDHVALAARAETGSNAAVAARQAQRVVELAEVAADLGRPSAPALAAGELGGTWRDQGERLATLALTVDGAQALVGSDDLASGIERVYGVDVGILDLGDSVDGVCAVQGQAAVILAAPTPVAARQRFTLAHELGHFLAGDDQGLRIDVDIMNPGRDGSEQRANAFAAAFLMPQHLLVERLGGDEPTREDVATLAVELGVSPSALAYRLERLRLIDGMTAARLADMTGKQAQQLSGEAARWSQLVTTAKEERVPRHLAEYLYEAYIDGRTTLRPYARLLEADVEELRASLEDADL